MAQTYTGSCHCQAVRYRVELDLAGVMQCNCSICSRAGWLLAFVPAEKFTLETGEEALTDYQFGKKHLHHPFCKTCGVRSFSHGTDPAGKETIAINTRCLEDADLSQVPITHYDGKHQ